MTTELVPSHGEVEGPSYEELAQQLFAWRELHTRVVERGRNPSPERREFAELLSLLDRDATSGAVQVHFPSGHMRKPPEPTKLSRADLLGYINTIKANINLTDYERLTGQPISPEALGN